MGETRVGRVAELWRYPVKSFQGQQVDHLDVESDGVAGDRLWAVVDEAAGKVLSAKRWPALLMASAALDAHGSTTLTLPDGSTHEAGDPGTDAAVSAWLDHPVALRTPDRFAAPLAYELYLDAADDSSDTWEFPGPPGRWVDLAAVHLLTTASLAAAAGLHPEGQWDVRRFRPTALLDVDGDGFVEDAWVGSPVTVGGAEVDPFMATPRCSMPGRAQPGLPRDADIPRTLHREHGLNLGLYCQVTRPGPIAVGDPVVRSSVRAT